jgi:hypothetical protein
LQKSLPCANAQATLCGMTQAHIIDDHDEGRTHNRGFAAMLADEYILIFLFAINSSSSRRNSIWLFVVNFIYIFSISSGSGLDIIKFQHSSKPCPSDCEKTLFQL